MRRRRRYYKRSIKNMVIGLIIAIIIAGYQFIFRQIDFNDSSRFEVELIEVVDGDTAWFEVDGEKTKVRFLYIDTPESTKEVEPYGKEATEYVTSELENANKIELELNDDGDDYDKYDRLLAWVFVDDELLQEKIARQGYCEKFYDYGYDYTYKDIIVEADRKAKDQHLGIYSD